MIDAMVLFNENFVNFELSNGLGQSEGGRFESHLAVLLRHVDEKKHSSVLLLRASYGIQPTFIPGMTKRAGGEGFII